MITLDIDGTLVDDDLALGERTLSAISRAVGRGIHVSLVTGRMTSSAMRFAETLGLRDVVVGYQGALAREMPVRVDRVGRLLRHIPLSPEIARDAVAWSRRRPGPPCQPPRGAHHPGRRPAGRRLLGLPRDPRPAGAGPRALDPAADHQDRGRRLPPAGRSRSCLLPASASAVWPTSRSPTPGSWSSSRRVCRRAGRPLARPPAGRSVGAGPGHRRPAQRRRDARRGRAWDGDAPLTAARCSRQPATLPRRSRKRAPPSRGPAGPGRVPEARAAAAELSEAAGTLRGRLGGDRLPPRVDTRVPA